MNVPLAPVVGAVNVTVAPLIRFPPLSFTVACKAVGNAVLIATFCGVPAVVMMVAAGPVSVGEAEVCWRSVALPSRHLRCRDPTIALAVNAAAVATPLAFVVAVTTVPLFVPPVNVPLAPLVAAVTVNVTITPLNRFPPLSFTVACKAVGKAVLIAMLCVAPAVAVTKLALPPSWSG